MESDLLNIRDKKALLLVVTNLLPLIFGGGGGEELLISHQLLVNNFLGDTITIFAADADGNVVPIRRISSNTGFLHQRKYL